MPDIIHRVGIACPSNEVYKALTTDQGLSTWWTNDTTGAGDVGSVICFRFNGVGPDFRVIELISDSSVLWKHSGAIPEAWVETEVSFKLSYNEGQTYVLFKHSNWKETSDFMAHCSCKWAVFLLSLKDALETGKGRPFPNDIHIDHDE